MKNITIDFKVKTKIINRLLEKENIKKVKKRTFLDKLTFAKKEFADVYFHTGSIKKEDIEKIENAKKIIVNSNKQKSELIKQQVDKSKIEIIYPSIDAEYKKPKEVKKQFCEEFNLDTNTMFVFFTAQNFKNSGSKEFINIVNNLNFKNLKAIVAGDKKEISGLRFQLSKEGLDEKILFFTDYNDLNRLFLVADIFVLPTHTKAFAKNILRAMFFKCAVFVPSTCASSEIVDVFATMMMPSDGSAAFKIDALLGRKEDLKHIKKQNRITAQEFTIDKNLEKIELILQSV
ncbi:glycosyltransferase [Malaciobacter marinus]|uniref:glycosyltransferase n=1 Tax=Malaciobacter marinus TaxID=505249 RepID=UPI003B007AC2